MLNSLCHNCFIFVESLFYPSHVWKNQIQCWNWLCLKVIHNCRKPRFPGLYYGSLVWGGNIQNLESWIRKFIVQKWNHTEFWTNCLHFIIVKFNQRLHSKRRFFCTTKSTFFKSSIVLWFNDNKSFKVIIEDNEHDYAKICLMSMYMFWAKNSIFNSKVPITLCDQ